MIPIQKQPEPEEFDETVRQPGKRFLAKHPEPDDWKSHDYWRHAKMAMFNAYREICAYLAVRCSFDGFSIDHFKPKSKDPGVAYEWDNFRLARLSVNRFKGVAEVLDPFTLAAGTFCMDFPSMRVICSESLEEDQRIKARETLDQLQLNRCEIFIDERRQYISDYCQGQVSMGYLERVAPFIASEISRQNLTREDLERRLLTRLTYN